RPKPAPLETCGRWRALGQPARLLAARDRRARDRNPLYGHALDATAMNDGAPCKASRDELAHHSSDVLNVGTEPALASCADSEGYENEKIPHESPRLARGPLCSAQNGKRKAFGDAAGPALIA